MLAAPSPGLQSSRPGIRQDPLTAEISLSAPLIQPHPSSPFQAAKAVLANGISQRERLCLRAVCKVAHFLMQVNVKQV